MNTGFNGIGIRSVGRARRKLANLLCTLSGCVVEPQKINRTNPFHRKWENNAPNHGQLCSRREPLRVFIPSGGSEI